MTVPAPAVSRRAFWRVDAERADVFRRWLSLHWPTVLSDPAHVVKRDAETKVCIADGFVVKEYGRRRGGMAGVAGLLRSRSSRAYQTGRALIRSGVPVARPVAWLAARSTGLIKNDLLVTEFVANSLPLSRVLADEGVDPATQTAILDQLGALVGRFHRAGFSNRDMKDGNLLLTRSDGEISVYSVDMDGARRRWLIGRRRAWRDFHPILHSLTLYRWNTADARRRLLAAYNAHATVRLSEKDLRPLVLDPGCAMPGWSCHEITIRLSGLTRRALRIYSREEEIPWQSLAHRFWIDRLEPVESIRSSPQTVVQKWHSAKLGKNYYFKRFRVRSPWEHVKHLFRPSRAVRAFQGGELARRHGFNVPRSVCFMEATESGRTLGGGLVTEEVEGALPLDRLLSNDNDAAPLSPAKRRAIATDLGLEVGRWHSAGLVHGDMRHGNILCHGDGPGFAFAFLDNERTRSTSNRHERARNLVQLNMISPARLSLRDRLSFWKAYCRTAAGTRLYQRALRAEVVAWTQRRWREQEWVPAPEAGAE